MTGHLRAIFTLAALAAVTLPLIPLQIVLNRLALPARRGLPTVWHRLAARLIGLRIAVKGEVAHDRPLLIAANHVSWLDIVVLSACVPVSFIAKREVSDWPAFGTLARLQRTVFVNRERRSATGGAADGIARRLNEGDVMVLFAEGTSSSGAHVLSFRPALLGAAQKALRANETAWIQPAAIAYTHVQGMAATSPERPLTGFYGDMDMAPHLYAVLKEAAIDARLIFGKPHAVTVDTDRKALAKILEGEVRAMKTEALRGG